MSRKFPIVHTHETASCFNCGADLDGSHWAKSGYALGRGEFKQDCPKCSMATWYDIKREPVAA